MSSFSSVKMLEMIESWLDLTVGCFGGQISTVTSSHLVEKRAAMLDKVWQIVIPAVLLLSAELGWVHAEALTWKMLWLPPSWDDLFLKEWTEFLSTQQRADCLQNNNSIRLVFSAGLTGSQSEGVWVTCWWGASAVSECLPPPPRPDPEAPSMWAGSPLNREDSNPKKNSTIFSFLVLMHLIFILKPSLNQFEVATFIPFFKMTQLVVN